MTTFRNWQDLNQVKNNLETSKKEVLSFLATQHGSLFLKARETPEETFKRYMYALSDLMEICEILEPRGEL